MKKLVLIIAAVLCASASAFADGLDIAAEIPVENSGKAGVYVLEQDGEVIQELSLADGESGCFIVDLHALDSFDYTVRQEVPRSNALTEYDMSVYKVTVTTLLSDEGSASSFYSVQKEGEEGKAERIRFFNYIVEQDVPKTGDSEVIALYLAVCAATFAAGLLTALKGLKKRRG